VKISDILLEALVTSTEEALRILGLSSEASADDIKKKYRSLVMANHPDRGGDVEEIKKINVAKDFLDKETDDDGPNTDWPDWSEEQKPYKDPDSEPWNEPEPEEEEYDSNESREALFDIAKRIRQRVLKFKHELKKSTEWQRALAKALMALSGDKSEIEEAYHEMKKINDGLNSAEIAGSRDSLPFNYSPEDEWNLISDAGKEISDSIKRLAQLIGVDNVR